MEEHALQIPNAESNTPRSSRALMIIRVENNGGVYNARGNQAPSMVISPVRVTGTVDSIQRRDGYLLAWWTFNVLFKTSISTELLYSVENL